MTILNANLWKSFDLTIYTKISAILFDFDYCFIFLEKISFQYKFIVYVVLNWN